MLNKVGGAFRQWAVDILRWRQFDMGRLLLSCAKRGTTALTLFLAKSQ